MSTAEVEKKVEEEKGGELLFCGATCWDTIGRKKAPAEGNLVSPTRLRPLLGVDIRFVASGCGRFCFALVLLFLSYYLLMLLQLSKLW